MNMFTNMNTEITPTNLRQKIDTTVFENANEQHINDELLKLGWAVYLFTNLPRKNVAVVV